MKNRKQYQIYNAIVLIDDFKVPENDWKYDSYNNTNLTIDSVDIPVYKSFFQTIHL